MLGEMDGEMKFRRRFGMTRCDTTLIATTGQKVLGAA